ncbi:PREDICTED: pentatricopeptide repeat-containing protein At3g14330-like [Camelina sativa]|uniref:Pentatricopeptide repeat-containing protein At3g14330-like n=1 Tax=Camelina sativa TaxID=90675 RepID=A0ABM0T0X7_CAMSA|nr:PREDICTED: pentatricopeptide repeat-containing protein At3g14330-like [Camelina sativa]
MHTSLVNKKPYKPYTIPCKNQVNVEKTRRMMIRKWWRSVGSVGKCDGRYDGVRTMVGKASNRAGVHGSKLPDAKALDNVTIIVAYSNFIVYVITTSQAYLTPLVAQRIITHAKFLQTPSRQSTFSKHLELNPGLSKSTKLDEAVTLIENSSSSSSSPSNLSSTPEAYTDLLHACISAKSLHHGLKISSLILNNPNLRHNPKLLSKLITLFSVCRRLDLARKMFDDVTDSTLLTEKVWAAMAIGYSRNGSPRDALLVYVNMLCSFIQPGNFSISVALKACVGLKDLRVGKGIHGQIVKRREKVDQVVYNVLLKLYMERGSFDDARKVFDGMSERNIATWNSLISVLSKKARVHEMFHLFRKMQEEMIGFSWATLTTILPACSRVAALLTGKEIHAQILKSKEKEPDVPLLNSLMNMYGKCGEVEYSRRVFDGMLLTKDLTSWNTMLNCYAINGDIEEEMNLFDWMIESGVAPDGVTFVALLSGCSDTGFTEYGLSLFERMKTEFGVSPALEHYACLVDILGRAGKIEEAVKIVETMPFKPSASVWGSLLNSCRLHGNVSVGEIAAKELFVLEPHNPGNYVMVSNLYADAKMWDNVDKIREMMRQRGIKKEAGCSWVQVKDKIQTFVAGGGYEFRSSDEYKKVWTELQEAIDKSGYSPDTSVVLHDVDEVTKANWVCRHSERLATTYSLIHTGEGVPIRVTKNLRVCADCHSWMKIVSQVTGRVIVLRDTKRFHHFVAGICSCKDYW